MTRLLLAPSAVIESVRVRSRPIVWAALFYIATVVYLANAYVRVGSNQALTLLIVAALAPLGAYFALRTPLIFPFCAYILLLPFDSLSSLGSGGTLAKLLGLLTAGTVFVRVMRRGKTVPVPRAVLAWLLLLFWMFVSMLWALQVDEAKSTFQTYASLVALFALLAAAKTTYREFNTILGSVVLAGVISAGYDAYLYHSGQGLVAANAGVSRVMIVVGDSQIDPNALAAALVLPTAIALYWLFNSRHFLLAVTMLPTLAILLLGFAASGSRGGYIELVLVFVYLIVRSRHRLWLASLLVAAVIVTLIANPGLPARFADAQQDGGAGRRDIWNIGMHAFRDYWFAGAGVGNFHNAFDREYLNVYSQNLLGWDWAAHNVPLTIATELGVVGCAIFIGAAFFQFRVLRGLALDDAARFELRLVLEAAFLGIMVSGFSTSDLNGKYVWLSFSLMVLYRGYLLSEKSKRMAKSQISPRAAPCN